MNAEATVSDVDLVACCVGAFILGILIIWGWIELMAWTDKHDK